MKMEKRISRRELSMLMAMVALESSIPPGVALLGSPSQGGWEKYAGNPVLGGQFGTCFDVCVLHEAGLYKMWVSWRPRKCIALTESKDGIHWNPPAVVSGPDPDTGWEDEVNRPIVVHRGDAYHMWYTGQANGKSKIGYAKSRDGRNWVRQSPRPVLEPTVSWEGVAVMCPYVMWVQEKSLWRMWYSAGEQYEPNAIGYATSPDGLRWNKYPSNPVMTPERGALWERQRVTAAQIVYWKGWYYSFYIGFSDIDHAQIGLARSRDGIENWVRHAGNPIVRPTPGGWDADACYKPYAVCANGRWMLWYNGRKGSLEQIGLVTHSGKDFRFVAKSEAHG
jgi:beta-1,2-mannobiose phosphorylase / 1,2-beta-oligomannan phosphorylase